ncbi:MAG: hypothetical protein A3F12_04590 [Gammaproteobacteria bacterium RIFCSPHIGHO2_12_FULL_38_14]|nr:MAG: hypothetical protein A3F12_04590 [Gammaproteobacteria bacterium RIFCSPHIGHO2_12_FULL_38_14]
MQRWDANTMQTIGSKLFDKIHKRKKHSHHNHEIHFMARDRQWLPEGIQLLVDGSYEPRCLKRYYFTDEMVDQLHISDRIFQHILLRILKPTFKHVMNPNCYHLDGPTGVKNATQKIREVLQKEQPKYFIRADIKSFYKSILHHKLIQDILILCKTKRQLNRCKRRMMNVLQERHLRLSKRKTRMGEIKSGFHFLGIEYPPTQTADNTNVAPVNDNAIVNVLPDYCLNNDGGGGENYYQSITGYFAYCSARQNTA